MSRRPSCSRFVVTAFLSLAFAAAQATTITVNSTADVALNDGQCTLREAIVAANTNTASGAAAGECAAGIGLPTPDVIVFAIAGAGVKTITPASLLPPIVESLVINGANGGSASDRIQLSGAGSLATGLNFSAANSQVLNLIVNGFTSRQLLFGFNISGVFVQGTMLGLDATGTSLVADSGNGIETFGGVSLTIGGTTAAARNVITAATSTAILIDGGSATIQGNFIGLNAAGTAKVGDPSTGIQISNAFGSIGGSVAGAGNVIATRAGVRFGGNPALGRSSGTVQGNFIGTDVTGTIALNLTGEAGVEVAHATGVQIIGNLISGNGEGIVAQSSGVSGNSSFGSIIQGNLIGTAANGTSALGNTRRGILNSNSPDTLIGGLVQGEGNTIAFNGQHGVQINGGTGNAILRNLIFGNGQLGIDLVGGTGENAVTGVTPNDAGDADTGSNNLQNFPVITSTSVNAGNVLISGTLNSTSLTPFRIEFFSNTACDASGNGEGQTFLGSTDVNTDGSGNATFTNVSFPVAGGTVITATATSNVDLIGNVAAVRGVSPKGFAASIDTSEFSACLVSVVPPPTIAKQFGTASIALNGTTTLTFTITNQAQGNAPLTGVAFTDTLPAGLVVATPNGLTGTCGSGTITATAGSGSVSLSGGTLGAGGSCTFSVNVTGTSAGVKNNSVTVTSTEGGTGNTATASLTVVAPPAIAKSFGAASIGVNGNTTLSFTITNPNAATALTGVAFTDTLPAGLVVATPNGLTGTCGGGTITATAGAGTVSLTGATLAGGAQCAFSINVTGTTPGTKNNSVSVTSTNGGAGNTATASVDVTSSVSIGKSFGAATIPLNGTTTLSFTITNPNAASPINGIAFTDTLPAGLVVATPNGLTGTCTGTISAVAGSGTISLSDGTLAASGSCTLAVNVTGTTAGVKNNSVTVSSNTTGQGNTATASVTVVAPATLAKSFGGATLSPGGTTTLTFTLTNPNTTVTLTGVGFTDTFPGGLVVSTPNGLAGTCGGGTITAVAGSNSVSLSGASLAPNASCAFTVNVTATGSGPQNNITSAVSSVQGGTGGTAAATLVIIAAAAPAAQIPTLQEWALILLGALLALVAMHGLARRRRVH